MEDKNSVNVGKEHSLGVDVLSPQPPEQGLKGRELDAALAERVFGIKKIFYPRDYQSGNDVWGSVNAPHFIPSGKSPRTHMIDAKPIPHFSTDIAAAMEVVEKMREKGFRWEALTPRGTGWRIRCFPADDAPDGYTQFRGLLPEAICRAALATVNVPAQEMETQKLG